MKLSEAEAEEIREKIDSEGFEYYFTDYGADGRLEKLIGLDIKNFVDARSNLINALYDIGIDLDP